MLLLSVLGFCSCIKKPAWFGNFALLNGILLSGLLGVGLFLSLGFLLPDRMYPFLQIFCLVFLGSFGILWLYNSSPPKTRPKIVGAICILVVLMSFFSLASIINGFETSLFVGNEVAYQKSYTTSQEVSFNTWINSFILNENLKNLSPAINANGIVEIDKVRENQYVFFDRTYLKTGIIKSEGKFGQLTFIKINNGQLISKDIFSSYYDNGLIIMMNNIA